MKIIHLVLGKANPNRMNGVNKVVNSLVTYQHDLGYDVEIWGITHTPNSPAPERNFETKLFPALKHKFWLDSSIQIAIKEIVNSTIFHIHGGFIPEFYHISKLLKKHVIPYVHTAHGAYNTIAMQRSRWIKKIYFQAFEKLLLKNAKVLHFIGNSELVSINELLTNPNCVLIPNGQHLSNSRIALKRKFDSPIFGFCGRLDIHTKGLDILLEAFALYSKHRPLSELWIIGDGKERATLEQMAEELEISSQVIFWGKKFGAQKDEIFKQIDVFFHPSRNEGLPGAVLEAAAMNIPCVVSQESNMGSYISNYCAGRTLNVNDAPHLSCAMLEMYHVCTDAPAYIRMQRNTDTMVKSEFDWKNIALDHIKMYQQIFTNQLQIV